MWILTAHDLPKLVNLTTGANVRVLPEHPASQLNGSATYRVQFIGPGDDCGVSLVEKLPRDEAVEFVKELADLLTSQSELVLTVTGILEALADEVAS